jgi:hypothetical protein
VVNLVVVLRQGEVVGVVLEDTDTRETFPGDHFDTLVADPQGWLHLVWSWAEEVVDEAAEEQTGFTVLARFRDREAEVLWGEGSHAALRPLLAACREKFEQQK